MRSKYGTRTGKHRRHPSRCKELTWDARSDGKIDKAEWINKVSNNADIAHLDLHNLWDEHDKDKNGYLDENEFGSMFVRMLEATEMEKQVKIFWTLVDRNKDGKLQVGEFEDMIAQLELDDDSAATLVRFTRLHV